MRNITVGRKKKANDNKKAKSEIVSVLLNLERTYVFKWRTIQEKQPIEWEDEKTFTSTENKKQILFKDMHYVFVY